MVKDTEVDEGLASGILKLAYGPAGLEVEPLKLIPGERVLGHAEEEEFADEEFKLMGMSPQELAATDWTAL